MQQAYVSDCPFNFFSCTEIKNISYYMVMQYDQTVSCGSSRHYQIAVYLHYFAYAYLTFSLSFL